MAAFRRWPDQPGPFFRPEREDLHFIRWFDTSDGALSSEKRLQGTVPVKRQIERLEDSCGRPAIQPKLASVKKNHSSALSRALGFLRTKRLRRWEPEERRSCLFIRGIIGKAEIAGHCTSTWK
jgi:hypothetical protein